MSHFSSVFLCVSKDSENFKCKEFNSFLEADDYYMNRFNYAIGYQRTMITSCKFIPSFMRTYQINKQLEKIFSSSFKTTIVNPNAHLCQDF